MTPTLTLVFTILKYSKIIPTPYFLTYTHRLLCHLFIHSFVDFISFTLRDLSIYLVSILLSFFTLLSVLYDQVYTTKPSGNSFLDLLLYLLFPCSVRFTSVSSLLGPFHLLSSRRTTLHINCTCSRFLHTFLLSPLFTSFSRSDQV